MKNSAQVYQYDPRERVPFIAVFNGNIKLQVAVTVIGIITCGFDAAASAYVVFGVCANVTCVVLSVFLERIAINGNSILLPVELIVGI